MKSPAPAAPAQAHAPDRLHLSASDCEGVVDYAAPHTAFSDLFAPFALSAAGTDQLGVHRLYFKGLGVDGSTHPTLQPLARIFLLSEAAEWQPLGVTHRVCTPWGWREQARTDDFEIEQEVFMPANHAAKITWRLRARHSRAPAPRLGVLGAVEPGQARLSGNVAPEGLAVTVTKSYDNWFLKRVGICHAHFLIHDSAPLRAAGFSSDAAPPPAPDTLPSFAPAGSHSYWVEPQVAAGPEAGTWTAQLVIAWDFTTTPVPDPASLGATAAQSSRRWLEMLSALPAPRPDTLAWRRRAAQAFSVLIGCGVRAPGYGAFGQNLAVPATTTGWASTGWFWDHFYSVSSLGYLSADWQTEAVLTYARHTSGRRMVPGILLAHPEQSTEDQTLDCYAPIATWALSKTWRAGGPRPALSAIYPGLLAIHEGWFAHCDRDGDGIPEWRNSGNPADDSPLYDPYSPAPGKAGCFPLPPFISVNLCSYLLMDARLLAGLADEQGLAADATRLRTRATRLETVLLERCWDTDAAFFFDLTPEGEKHRVKTFFGLLPLWAGVALPAADARHAIERHLLNPREFWGSVPFPSVAYDEPSYDPVGYWRGRCWPHLYFWNTELLWQHGYEAEAEHARAAFLHQNTIWPGPMENFPSDPRHAGAHVLPNYNWGASALFHFLSDWHRLPLIPQA